MDKKTAGIIGVIVTLILCGLPGLASLCIGPLGIFGASQPDVDLGTVEPGVMIAMFVAMICLSVVFIAIPIAIGFLTLYKPLPKPVDLDSPIPEEDF